MSESNHQNHKPAAANAHTMGLTICNLCGKKFSGPSALVIGQPAIQPYLEEITKHFIKAHKEEEQAIGIKALEFLGMLRLMNFRTADPDIAKQIDYLRWQIHQQTLSARIPDDKLIERTEEVAARLVEMFCAVLKMACDAKVESMPTVMGELEPIMRKNVRETLEVIFRGIRDVLQEPNKYPSATHVTQVGSNLPS